MVVVYIQVYLQLSCWRTSWSGYLVATVYQSVTQSPAASCCPMSRTCKAVLLFAFRSEAFRTQDTLHRRHYVSRWLMRINSRHSSGSSLSSDLGLVTGMPHVLQLLTVRAQQKIVICERRGVDFVPLISMFEAIHALHRLFASKPQNCCLLSIILRGAMTDKLLCFLFEIYWIFILKL